MMSSPALWLIPVVKSDMVCGSVRSSEILLENPESRSCTNMHALSHECRICHWRF